MFGSCIDIEADNNKALTQNFILSSELNLLIKEKVDLNLNIKNGCN
jgi:hypothetical protein